MSTDGLYPEKAGAFRMDMSKGGRYPEKAGAFQKENLEMNGI